MQFSKPGQFSQHIRMLVFHVGAKMVGSGKSVGAVPAGIWFTPCVFPHVSETELIKIKN